MNILSFKQRQGKHLIRIKSRNGGNFICFNKTKYIISYFHSKQSNIKSNHFKRKLDKYKEFYQFIQVTLPLLFQGEERKFLPRLIDKVVHMLTNQGEEYVVRYLKATEESVESYVLALSGKLEHKKVSLGKDEDGWPSWLDSRLKSNCQLRQKSSIRLCFTICATRRLLTVPIRTNLSSITTPPTYQSEIPIKEFLLREEKVLKYLFQNVRNPEIGSEQVHSVKMTSYVTPKPQLSLKHGPNGITFFTFPWDRAAIVKHQLEEKVTAFAETYFRGDVEHWIQDKLEPYEQLVDSNRQKNVGKISLSWVPGKLKPRVFAIVDSFTQSLLADFHQDLMDILKQIAEDCTFDQDKVKEIAKREALKHKPFYGYADLSNASDRLPAYLYQAVGDHIRLGLGTTWVALFDRDFLISDLIRPFWSGPEKCPKSIRYQCGQPMGALSSWPFMALVHHLLVWYAFGSRKRAKGRYLILGDDIVIFDKIAYHKYISILDQLSVSYSSNISVIGFEFAKRIFYKGSEVTGAYSIALWQTRLVPELFFSEWRNLSSRGYYTGDAAPSLLLDLLKVNRSKREWMNILMTLPCGSEISDAQISRLISTWTGRSFCHLESSPSDNTSLLLDSIKSFRVAAALLIQQKFQNDLNVAKAAIEFNVKYFVDQFTAHSGLIGKFAPVMQSAISEFLESSKTRIRYLERDLKRAYLMNPSNAKLLRPDLPDLPRRFDFSKRDSITARNRFRSEHQKKLYWMLQNIRC